MNLRNTLKSIKIFALTKKLQMRMFAISIRLNFAEFVLKHTQL